MSTTPRRGLQGLVKMTYDTGDWAGRAHDNYRIVRVTKLRATRASRMCLVTINILIILRTL